MDLIRTLARRLESGKSEALKVLITFVIKSSTILISSDKQRRMIIPSADVIINIP